MNCLQALQKQSQTLTAEAKHLSQQLQMLQKDVQDKQQLHKHTKYIEEWSAVFMLMLFKMLTLLHSCRDLYAAHLQEQRALMDEYTDHCNSSASTYT